MPSLELCRCFLTENLLKYIFFDRIFLSYNIYLPEIEKVLLKNANFLKKFSVAFYDLAPKEKIHLFIGARSEKRNKKTPFGKPAFLWRFYFLPVQFNCNRELRHHLKIVHEIFFIMRLCRKKIYCSQYEKCKQRHS